MPANQALDILRRARERISKPGQWTQNAGARDARGEFCDPRGNEAARWCALGAVQRECASPLIDPESSLALLRRAAFEAGRIGITTLNDNFAHAHVLAMFDRAIALAEEASRV